MTKNFWHMPFTPGETQTVVEWACEASHPENPERMSHRAIAQMLNSDPRNPYRLTKHRVRHAILRYAKTSDGTSSPSSVQPDSPEASLPEDDAPDYEELEEYYTSRAETLIENQTRHTAQLNREISRLEQIKATRENRVYDALSFLKPYALPAPFPPEGATMVQRGEEAVIHLTDIHFGEVVHKERTHGLNAYNMDICFARMDYLATQIFQKIQAKNLHGSHVAKGIILLGGDLYHNDTMRPSAKKHSQMLSTDQKILATRMLEVFILRMAHIFPQVEVYAVPGNHGRIGPKEQEPSMNNDDMHIVQVLGDMLRRRGDYKDRIKVIPSRALHVVFPVAGFTGCLDHGHMVRSWSSQNPLPAIIKRVQRINDMEYRAHRSMPNYHFVGHFHTYGALTLPNGCLRTSDSVVGTSTYGMDLGLAGDASQCLYFVHPVHGLHEEHRIFLNSIGKSDVPRQVPLYMDDLAANALYAWEDAQTKLRG